MLEKRQSLANPRKDLFRHFLAEDSESSCLFTQDELQGNTELVVIAGADTTASTLTQIFWKLCQDQLILRRLQAEVDAAFTKEGRLGVEETRSLPYLNAVMNEGLRLLNPVPSGVSASVAEGGVEINGVFIPAGTEVTVPHLVVMTDERYFPRGMEFWPERWLLGEEGVKEKKAFIPFGYGLHSCVGKQLAMNESMLILSFPFPLEDSVKAINAGAFRMRLT